MNCDIYSQIEAATQAAHLAVYGAFHPSTGPVTGGTIILLGTDGSFWQPFTRSPEWNDGQPDPIDRWSTRVVTELANRFTAQTHFPFGGPPFKPFVQWALASGRAFTSPSQLLVHDEMGLMLSYRGALHLADKIDIPVPRLAQSPCPDCTIKACIYSCPASALVDGGPYQVASCHKHLDTAKGQDCMDFGCLARRRCPLSVGAARSDAQSAHHMRYFHAP
ncbi:ferredoxin [Epibacterium sp. SM1979]|uniref:Ferredoxin n=1 Tax=Tritonibacter litoralis TaxID=2662264 RepID=A0A843YFJ3_9RHOB|nr:ferredoxin [Tritonibacter litoralis]